MIPNRKRFRSLGKYALACGSELLSPLIRAVSKSDRETPPQAWRRGLLLGADHIGDVLYNTASLPHLRQGLPECRWSYVAEAPADEVLAGNPNVDSVLSRSLVKRMPAGSFDVAICYNSSSTSRDLLFAARLQIPNRVGYPDKGFSSLVTFPIKIRYPQPYPAYFRDLVGQVTRRPPDWDLRPQIFPTSEDMAAADEAWNSLGLNGSARVVACFATSRQPSGVWPAAKFAETLSHIEARSGAQTILCGTAGDAAALHALKRQFGLRAMIMAGELRLLALACFLRRCAVVLCPDSGPRHLANAVGTPVVFVRNLAVGKIETGVYCDTEMDVAPDVERVPRTDQPDVFARLRPEMISAVVTARISPTATRKIHSP